MERFAQQFTELVAGVVAEPERPLHTITHLDAAQHHQVVVGWNDTEHELPDSSVVELFDQQVVSTPDAVAVIFDDIELTYREFASRVDRLAGYLVGRGVGAEVRVGVLLDRSIDLLVSVWAIWKSGGVYVPLDPEYPVARLSYMLADSGVGLVLTETAHAGLVTTAQPVVLDDPAIAGEIAVCRVPAVVVVPAGAAGYVIYTSGSTGRPKGVVTSRVALSAHVCWMQGVFGLGADDRVLHKTSVSFDVSVWELVWGLTCGAAVVVARPGGHRDPRYLAELVVEHKVTTLHFVPSMLEVFVREPAAAGCVGVVRRVLCSGEALPSAVLSEAVRVLGPAVHNLYGPTEAAIDVTWWTAEGAGARVPIGRPVWNTAVLVLDRWLRPVPVGVAGEVYVSGVQLARGYHGRAGLTADRFVANPFDTGGGRLYRTGDVGLWGADGNVEYLGRADGQVKVRGFRIEPGEIDATLATHPAVSHATVLIREDHPGDQRLIAYLIPDPDQSVTAEDLRAYLTQSLPAYMVPAGFVFLEQFPITSNGKLDRKALPAPEFTGDGDDTQPCSPTEEILAEMWAEVLGVDQIGVHQDFFDLGGNSILSLQVIARMRNAFNLDFSVKSFFDGPTVALLAGVVEEQILLELEESLLSESGGDGAVAP
jgi:amino acid adenylation domain-containing protein